MPGYKCTHLCTQSNVTLLPANCRLDDENLYQRLQNDMPTQVNLEDPKLMILVTGKIGVGKSTLVNSLVGMDMAETGDEVASVWQSLTVGRNISLLKCINGK